MNNKERERDEEVEIDLKELFFILLHHLWIIVLAGIVLAAGMFVYTRSFVTPLYSSTASVYVLNRQSSDQLTYSDLNSSMQLTKDYQQMFVSRTVLEQVIENLHLQNTDGSVMSPSTLANKISISSPSDTRIINLTVTDASPAWARDIVDELCRVGSTHITQVMKIEGINVNEAGNLPTFPSSPNLKKNVLLGAVAGVVLSAAAIIVLHLMNDTIRTGEDVERYLDVSLMGVIPETKKGKKGRANKKDELKKAGSLTYKN